VLLLPLSDGSVRVPVLLSEENTIVEPQVATGPSPTTSPLALIPKASLLQRPMGLISLMQWSRREESMVLHHQTLLKRQVLRGRNYSGSPILVEIPMPKRQLTEALPWIHI
jgi:hypothetical protein